MLPRHSAYIYILFLPIINPNSQRNAWRENNNNLNQNNLDQDIQTASKITYLIFKDDQIEIDDLRSPIRD